MHLNTLTKIFLTNATLCLMFGVYGATSEPANKPASKDNDGLANLCLNLNSSSGSNTPLAFLRDKLKFKIPKVSARDEDGNYIQKKVWQNSPL